MQAINYTDSLSLPITAPANQKPICHKPSSISCKVLLQNFKKYIEISIESIPTRELAVVFFRLTIAVIVIKNRHFVTELLKVWLWLAYRYRD